MGDISSQATLYWSRSSGFWRQATVLRRHSESYVVPSVPQTGEKTGGQALGQTHSPLMQVAPYLQTTPAQKPIMTIIVLVITIIVVVYQYIYASIRT